MIKMCCCDPVTCGCAYGCCIVVALNDRLRESCTHYHDGKSAIHPINNEGDVFCSMCGKSWNINVSKEELLAID